MRKTKLSSSVAERSLASKGSVQSVEVGMQILIALADRGGEETLTGLAEATGISAAKVHRYLVGLIAAGMVERNSIKYALGPQALRIGLVALGRLNAIEGATAELHQLRERIDETVLLAIWGENGPTIVRWIESGRPVTVNVRVGSVMPLRSATGQMFGAYLPESVTRPFLEKEIAEAKKLGSGLRSTKEAQALFAQARKAGIGHTSGGVLTGVLGLAAPVFDYSGNLAAVIACLGPSGFFDDRPDGPTAAELRLSARRLSERLGHKSRD